MSGQEENDQRNISPEFSGAANPEQPLEEQEMSLSTEDFAISLPFTNHRLYTEHDVSHADIDRILHPILRAHGIASNDYNPDNLSYRIGEKTIQLSLKDYERDENFEGEMNFIRRNVFIRKAIIITNMCSIKGTEILIDFLKSFQKEYLNSFFEEFEDVYFLGHEIQKLFVDPETLCDPDLAPVLEEGKKLELKNDK